MRIWRFVITGGPCSGRKTCFSILEQSLIQNGFNVIIVPEATTELINSNLFSKKIDSELFQSMLVDKCINNENIACTASISAQKDTVILYSKGLLDYKAYSSLDIFEKILSLKGIDEYDILCRYDAVFHLVSASNGANFFYKLFNNTANSKSIEKAKRLDLEIQQSWSKHPNLNVIDNSTNFDKKIYRLLNNVYSLIDLPIYTHSTKKYLVDMPVQNQFPKFINIYPIDILETYLYSKDDSIQRLIRKIRSDGNIFFYYIETSSIVKKERKITKDEYYLLMASGKKSVRKKKYYFLYEKQYCTLVKYPEWFDKAILEINSTYENSFICIPNWINVIKEVTNMPSFEKNNPNE